MTAYFETANVAHVMELRSGDYWRSVCRARVEIRFDDWRGRFADFPVQHVWTIWGSRGEQPRLRWCRWCVVRLQRDVEEAIGSVLEPAAARAVAS